MNGSSQDHIVIRRSVTKLLGLALIGVAFVAIGLWMIQGGAVDSRGEGSIFIGWVTTVFFGLAGLVPIYRLTFGHQVPLELSPKGFWDKRALKQSVPWSAVLRISVWSYRGTSMLHVQLTKEAVQHAKLSQFRRVTRRLEKPFGLDCIYVSSDDLEISFQELRLLFQRYLSDHNPTAKDDTQ